MYKQRISVHLYIYIISCCFFLPKLFIKQGWTGNKYWHRETENTAQFWANNKIFLSYRPKFIQAAQIFDRPCRQRSRIRHPSQSSPAMKYVLAEDVN